MSRDLATLNSKNLTPDQDESYFKVPRVVSLSNRTQTPGQKIDLLRQVPGQEQCSRETCGNSSMDQFAAQDQDLTIYQANAPILTPYAHPIRPINPIEKVRLKPSQVNPYDLFVLQTRLRPILAQIDPALDLRFDARPGSTDVPVFIYLMKGCQYLGLQNVEAHYFEQKIRHILQSDFPRHCCLLSNHLTPKVQGRSLPKYWIRSVLPFLVKRIDQQYEPQLLEGQLLVNFKESLDFKDSYNYLYQRLAENLAFMFERGYIVASPLERPILRAWRLEIMEEENEIYLCRPSWYDTHITNGHLTHFLRTRLLGLREIALPLGSNWADRHLMAYQLLYHWPHLEFWFSADYVYILVDDYPTALACHHLVTKIKTSGRGRVIYLAQSLKLKNQIHSLAQISKIQWSSDLTNSQLSLVTYLVREGHLEQAKVSLLALAPENIKPQTWEQLQDWLTQWAIN